MHMIAKAVPQELSEFSGSFNIIVQDKNIYRPVKRCNGFGGGVGTVHDADFLIMYIMATIINATRRMPQTMPALKMPPTSSQEANTVEKKKATSAKRVNFFIGI